MASEQKEITEELSLGLAELSPVAGSRRKRKRVGVGEGSGNGKTCGKGHKGQNSRSGAKRVPGFEGGQMPLHRRLPKRGFTSRKRVRGENLFSLVSLDRLNEFDFDGELTIELLREHKLVSAKGRKVKILGGTLEKKVVVEAHAASAAAKAAVEAAGGEIRIVSK